MAYAKRADLTRALNCEQVVSVFMSVHEDACVYFQMEGDKQVKLNIVPNSSMDLNGCSFFKLVTLDHEDSEDASVKRLRVPALGISQSGAGEFSSRHWYFVAMNYYEMDSNGKWQFQ